MGILSGNPKNEPLHYGEIFSVWQCSMVAKGAISCYQAFLNHAGDKDLKKLLDDLLDQAKLEIKECDTLLTENGIAPAPMLQERPPVKLDDIPAGARFTDPEIAAILAADTSLGLVAASQVIGQSIREDIGALFAKYHATKMALGVRILQMTKEKGWLVPPPLQIKRPESDET
ncbi:DUF3231 family protein [Paenibacillus sp. UMB7766-LJ446]|uniref:DUF3231 family protein n=1 Tax=Paenibacillus sp. UMB7766-LJ446 TaxID=3046313 RepID=UPI002550FE3D|nr:DUF3231 family protein [Paenibacillus sp. UMB7766-LJ446]MDK8189865.1 DUF3231 family protein [Paenibacillus sp. UMB7766-LJ446]